MARVQIPCVRSLPLKEPPPAALVHQGKTPSFGSADPIGQRRSSPARWPRRREPPRGFAGTRRNPGSLGSVSSGVESSGFPNRGAARSGSPGPAAAATGSCSPSVRSVPRGSFLHREIDGDPTLLHDVDPVADLEQVRIVVVDHDIETFLGGEPFTRSMISRGLTCPHGGQWLVQQQDLCFEPRVARRDGDRLTLATGELVALGVDVRDVDLDVVEVCWASSRIFRLSSS